MNIAVIGGGIMGISSAFQVNRRIPGARITVFAEDFTPRTTSDLAAGHIEGGFRSIKETSDHKLLEWMKQTVDHLTPIARSSSAGEAGVAFRSGFDLFTKKLPNALPDWADLVLHIRKITSKELDLFPSEFVDGYFYTTLLCESRKYLPFLMKTLKESGVKFCQRRIKSFEELADHDLIINCSGYGASELATDDHKIFPMRGQIIMVRAPEQKLFVISRPSEGGAHHIIPRSDGVYLGGTFLKGDSSTNYRRDHSKMIWDNCVRLCPNLQTAEVIEERVGTRPGRRAVRLELEVLSMNDGRTLPVVHNYGHIGNGIVLHWGCAIEVASIVESYLTKHAHPKL